MYVVHFFTLPVCERHPERGIVYVGSVSQRFPVGKVIVYICKREDVEDWAGVVRLRINESRLACDICIDKVDILSGRDCKQGCH
jgi:hypothetical protein